MSVLLRMRHGRNLRRVRLRVRLQPAETPRDARVDETLGRGRTYEQLQRISG